MDRKAFISGLMRISLLGVLVLLTGFLMAKRNVNSLDSCNNNSLCSNCSKLSGCRKPEAIKQKKNGGK